MARPSTGVLIIGRGVAGLTLALGIADHLAVTLIGPADRDRGASRWAQGGIAAVLAADDSVERHVQDTLIAGDGLCDEDAVRFCVSQGPKAIDWLIDQGVPFTLDETPGTLPYHLTREGGHSARRVIHVDDATGRAVVDTLCRHVDEHPNITRLDDVEILSLLQAPSGRCAGAEGLDADGAPVVLTARHVVLATGGASGLYPHTTSSSPSAGEGMAMAATLGARLANLEFQQFHPTCLFDPGGPAFLISEAVRGEGGKLLNAAGERFMQRVDERLELAPRDIVARAIHREIQREGVGHVWLDLSTLAQARIRHHFPTILSHCASRGIDILSAPIPVVPAAHYSCGGVSTDQHGATSVAGLYAIGEVACTGLHGANRLASNSLLECLVYARSCADALLRAPARPFEAPGHMPGLAKSTGDFAASSALEERLKEVMGRHVGIVRCDAGLGEAATRLDELEAERLALGNTDHPGSRRFEQRVHLARLTVDAARARRESRGLHYSTDWPSGSGAAHASTAQATPAL
ncbi:L-aspartate oxidase [Halomonas sp. 707D7]|uniref:L-aspartate oxidase n=3 Tax=unclassified Halomonas TaxID=2609666 RepID=UPI00209CBF73|nr:L-aspartate oxidase [Halomonas sp. 707D7]MCP1314315.1 L-aspartate oxidase [Halomonas sp. 707D7]